MKIYGIDDILWKLDNCIRYNIPFSHIRFGDGGIKFLHCVLYNDTKQLGIIVKKEGIPAFKVDEIFELWGYYSRRADFIDTPEVYFNGEFWPRKRSPLKGITPKTRERLLMWPDLYDRAEFDNNSYCNPESNYLMILRRFGKKNIFDLMKGRKICIITVFPEIQGVLKDYDVDIVTIVGHYKNQYKNSFNNVIEKIKETATDYDFWLVAAGELGRIYSGYIKQCGGRTLDIGFVIEYWLGGTIHPRLHTYINTSLYNPLELTLTDEGKKYEGYI